MKTTLIALLFIPTTLALFFHLSRADSWAAGWVQVALIGLVSPGDVVAVAVWWRLHRAGRLPGKAAAAIRRGRDRRVLTAAAAICLTVALAIDVSRGGSPTLAAFAFTLAGMVFLALALIFPRSPARPEVAREPRAALRPHETRPSPSTCAPSTTCPSTTPTPGSTRPSP